MLRAIAICPDQQLTNRLEDQLQQTGSVTVVRNLDRYPTAIDLTRVLRANSPHIAFISIESLPKAIEVSNIIESTIPGIQIVAIDRTCEPQTLLELMRVGIREFLAMPFPLSSVMETLERIQQNLERRPTES